MIDKSYWYKLFFKCAVIFSAGILLTGLFLYFYISSNPTGHSYAESFTLFSQLRQQIVYKSFLLYTTSLIVIAIGIIAITLIYSHRIAGPVYRIRVVAESISQGNLDQRIQLRKNDSIKPMAHELNSLIDNYKNLTGDLRKKIGDLKTVISQPATSQLEFKSQVQSVLKANSEVEKIIKSLQV